MLLSFASKEIERPFYTLYRNPKILTKERTIFPPTLQQIKTNIHMQSPLIAASALVSVSNNFSVSYVAMINT